MFWDLEKIVPAFFSVLVWCLDMTGGIITVKTGFHSAVFVERHTVEVSIV